MSEIEERISGLETQIKRIRYILSHVKYFRQDAIKYSNNNKVIIIKENGEEIVNPPQIDGLSVSMQNSNNTLTIYEPFHFYGVKVDLRGDINVTIKKECTMGYDCLIKKTRNTSSNELIIGENFSCGYNCTIDLTDAGDILIGDDAKWSWNIYIKSDDTHPVFDINTGECLNKSTQIIIGKHVWIGMNVTVLKNSVIRDNSVIGACSVVAKKFTEENVCIVGNPAKIVKKNINWSHGSIKGYVSKKERK